MSKGQNNTTPNIPTSLSGGIAKPTVLNSEEIFAKNSFVYIEHDGQQYILRVTRDNKLILTK